ncbi:MAG TPA: GyrI-like domain-containing protein [Dehalococcoidia bacterium]|nr:GyrI-like domain-containing protein [Dehalococcoidia bacterium]
MEYEVSVVEVQEQRIASIRGSAPFDNLAPTIMELSAAVWTFLQDHHLQNTGHNVIQYDPTGLTEVGVQIFEDFTPVDPVAVSSTPGGRVATTTHIGEYRGLPGASQAVVAWCEANGHRLAGPSWEVYGDWTADESQLRTDVYFLLA